MNCKILLIGDPHLKTKHVQRIDLMIESILQTATEHKPDLIVVLGDLLHTHRRVDMSMHQKAYHLIKSLGQISKTVLLVGNHDRINNSDYMTEIHPFSGFECLENVSIAWKVIEDTINGFRFVFAPYVFPGRFAEALSTIDDFRSARAIFCHQEVLGAMLGGGKKSDIGDPWDLEYPEVYSGHIHGYQKVQENWWYIGSPMQHDFGDSEDRAICLLTLTETSREEQRIFLPGIPKLITIRVSCSELPFITIPEFDKVKVVVSGTSGELKGVPERIWDDLEKKGVIVQKKVESNQRIHQDFSKNIYTDVLLTRCDDLMASELKLILSELQL